MNNLILEINAFKQQIAYSINCSPLPADIKKYIFQDFVIALGQLASQELAEAEKQLNADNEEKKIEEKEEENDNADN